MNSQTLNAAALNSVVPTAQTVFIPSSSTGIAFTVFERASVSMAGTTGITLHAIGDVAKVALLGAVSTGISFVPAGDLAVSRRIAIDAVSIGVSFALTGILNADAYMPNASASMALGTSGTLSNFAQMQGSTGVTLAATAPAPAAVQYLHGDTGLNLDGVGLVSSLKPIPVSSTGIILTLAGQIGNPIRLNGISGFVFDVSAELSINPNAREPDDRIAVRQFQNRTAVR